MIKILNVVYATGLYAVIVWALYGDRLGQSGEGPRHRGGRTEFTGAELSQAPSREAERGEVQYGQTTTSLSRSVARTGSTGGFSA
jgi:hypothetical protein